MAAGLPRRGPPAARRRHPRARPRRLTRTRGRPSHGMSGGLQPSQLTSSPSGRHRRVEAERIPLRRRTGATVSRSWCPPVVRVRLLPNQHLGLVDDHDHERSGGATPPARRTILANGVSCDVGPPHGCSQSSPSARHVHDTGCRRRSQSKQPPPVPRPGRGSGVVVSIRSGPPPTSTVVTAARACRALHERHRSSIRRQSGFGEFTAGRHQLDRDWSDRDWIDGGGEGRHGTRLWHNRPQSKLA